jgi:hypothetical protein
MSTLNIVAANHFPPPVLGRCAVIATSTSSAITDLTADARISAHVADGTIFTFLADGTDIYIAFNNTNTGTIDETANSGATSCFKLPSNVPVPLQIAKGYTYMLTKAASGTPKLRIFASGYVDMAKTGT